MALQLILGDIQHEFGIIVGYPASDLLHLQQTVDHFTNDPLLHRLVTLIHQVS